MTVRRRVWQRPSALITASAAALVGVGLCAVPAVAHTPNWTVTCSSVEINLTAYNGGVTNTVTLTADGKDLLPTETFKSEFHKTLRLPEHSGEIKLHLAVKAGDSDKYSYQGDKVAPVCEGTPTPTPSESAPSQSPSATPSEKPSDEAPAPGKSASAAAPAPHTSSSAPADLAETGSSGNTPVIAGAAAVVVLAGGGLVFATRKRRGAQH